MPKDTDIVHIELDITLLQARYLKNKCHKSARESKVQYKRTHDDYHFWNEVMWEGLAEQLREKIKEIELG